jgi:RNA polymerase sigma factor (TIGR02999 family)
MERSGRITALLAELQGGDRDAVDALAELLYDELRKIAARYLGREREGHTLQPTALVHEAYMRLVNQRDVTWQNRAHFLGVAAQVMRRILVDHARAHHRDKRGGRTARVTLDDERVGAAERDVDLVALDDALGGLGTGRSAYLRYPVEGGDALPVEGLSADEQPIRWSADGRALFVFRPGELPARVHRVDVETGKRELWRELMPPDPAGVDGVAWLKMTPDASLYAYGYIRVLNDLYLVEGLP